MSIEQEKNTLLKTEAKSDLWKCKYKTPRHTCLGYAYETIYYKHIDIIRQVFDILAGSRVSVWRAKADKDDGC